MTYKKTKNLQVINKIYEYYSAQQMYTGYMLSQD